MMSLIGGNPAGGMSSMGPLHPGIYKQIHSLLTKISVICYISFRGNRGFTLPLPPVGPENIIMCTLFQTFDFIISSRKWKCYHPNLYIS